jgi:hypothetical protein
MKWSLNMSFTLKAYSFSRAWCREECIQHILPTADFPAFEHASGIKHLASKMTADTAERRISACRGSGCAVRADTKTL